MVVCHFNRSNAFGSETTSLVGGGLPLVPPGLLLIRDGIAADLSGSINRSEISFLTIICNDDPPR